MRLEHVGGLPTPSSSYVSFLPQFEAPKRRSLSQDSIRSVSSVRSSLSSSLSNLWSNFNILGKAETKAERRRNAIQEALRYLYSAFTKIPCAKFSVDPRIDRIKGYEEFPFDTAVPLFVFKNLTSLEISDIDFRVFYGWDRLSEQLQSLTLKRASLDDPHELLSSVVLDDMEERRLRASKTPCSPGWAIPSFSRPSEATESFPKSSPQYATQRPGSSDRAQSPRETPCGSLEDLDTSAAIGPIAAHRPQANGPGWVNYKARHQQQRSVASPPRLKTPKQSSIAILSGSLSSSKWRFLRHLSLSDNGLTSISSQTLSPLTETLQSLDLSFNLFTEIPESLGSLVSLRALNMSHCTIDNLRSLSRRPLPAINVFNLRNNRISCLAGIERLFSLERLDLRNNEFNDPSEMVQLTRIPEFRQVFVKFNPFTKAYPNHRVIIFNLFRTSPRYMDDIIIDATGPGFNERRHLVDRVVENLQAPVGVASHEGAGSEAVSGDQNFGEGDISGLEPKMASSTYPAPNEDDVPSTSKRKGSKRRIVDAPGVETAARKRTTLSTAYKSQSNDATGARALASQQGSSTSRSPDAMDSLPVAQSEPGTKHHTSHTLEVLSPA